MPRQYVRCCDYNREYDNIYFDDDPDSPCFREARGDDPFQYCPWCGILLDTNLPMTEGQVKRPDFFVSPWDWDEQQRQKQEALDDVDEEE